MSSINTLIIIHNYSLCGDGINRMLLVIQLCLFLQTNLNAYLITLSLQNDMCVHVIVFPHGHFRYLEECKNI
jgi:hypothetical protein